MSVYLRSKYTRIEHERGSVYDTLIGKGVLGGNPFYQWVTLIIINKLY